MRIELVDSLRCPRPHEDTWLVARVDRLAGRFIAEGSLGCPVCRAMYAVRGGTVWFVEPGAPGFPTGQESEPPRAAPLPPVWADPIATPDGRADERPRPEAEGKTGELLTRAAALLGLGEPGGIVLLGGTSGALALALEAMTGVTALLLDPAGDVALGAGVSAVRAGGAVPLAAGSLRAALMDRATATPPALAGVSRALRPGGRLVAPADLALPEGVDELARDSHEWVAARRATSTPPIPLRRNR